MSGPYATIALVVEGERSISRLCPNLRLASVQGSTLEVSPSQLDTLSQHARSCFYDVGGWGWDIENDGIKVGDLSSKA